MKKRRILSLLLAVAVMATMLVAVPLTASAESTASVTTKTPTVKLDYFAEMPAAIFPNNTQIQFKKVDYDQQKILDETADFSITALVDKSDGTPGGSTNDDAGVKSADSTATNDLTGIKTTKSIQPASNDFRNQKADTPNVTGLRYEFTPTSNGTFYVFNKLAGNRSIYLLDTSSGETKTCGNIGEQYETPCIVSGTNTKLGIFDVKKGVKYVVYMNNSTGNDNRGFGFVKESENPYVTINDAEQGASVIKSSVVGSKISLTAKYGNLGEQKVVWTSKDKSVVDVEDSQDVDGTSTAFIIPKTDEVGKSTTVTATYPNQVDNISEIEVTIKDALTDVIVQGSSGATGVVLESLDGAVEKNPDPIVWKRTDGKGINYTTILKDVPFGNYKITPSVEEHYAKLSGVVSANSVPDGENENEPYTLKVDLSIFNKTIAGEPAVTVNAARKTGMPEGAEIDYSLLSGHSITWDFTTSNGDPNEYVNYEGSEDSPVYSSSLNPKLYLIADTKSNYSEPIKYGSKKGGKFNSVSKENCIQCNGGTLLKIPVRKGSEIEITGGVTFTFAEELTADAFTNSDTKSSLKYTYKGEEDSFVYAVADNDGQNLSTIVVKTPPKFGEVDYDSGKYTSGNSYLGVIRFLQQFEGGKVKDYGFYVLDQNGEVKKGEIKKSAEGDGQTIDLDAAEGFFGDLTDIPLNDPTKYYFKAFVTTQDGKTYENSVKGPYEVAWETIVEAPSGE